jgi:hypothetical protein
MKDETQKLLDKASRAIAAAGRLIESYGGTSMRFARM